MKYPRYLLLSLLAVALFLTGGCSTQQAITAAEAGNALVNLEADYQQVREALHAELDAMPEEVAVPLLDLEAEVDRYVADLQFLVADKPELLLVNMERIYTQGWDLYTRGVQILSPQIDRLGPAARYELKRFSATIMALHDAYDRYQSGAANQQEMQLLGMELARLVINIGLMSL